MNKTNSVPEYIRSHPDRSDELAKLREILSTTALTETVKWGVPVYTFGGENIVGMAAFKSYVGLWFYQGVFLKDQLGVLINAQEGTTKGLRQWRFEDASKINGPDILEYVNEAIQNQKAGKKIKPEKKLIAIPEELEAAMQSDSVLKSKFEALTKGKRNDYAEHIGSAKQAKTRLSRLEKDIPLIMASVGLHDKYKK